MWICSIVRFQLDTVKHSRCCDARWPWMATKCTLTYSACAQLLLCSQSCSQRPLFFWLALRNRDLWEKSEAEPALVTAVTLSTYVQKPLLNLNACAQSNQNQGFLVLVFDLAQSVACSVTADRKRAGSGNEIAQLIKPIFSDVPVEIRKSVKPVPWNTNAVWYLYPFSRLLVLYWVHLDNKIITRYIQFKIQNA